MRAAVCRCSPNHAGDPPPYSCSLHSASCILRPAYYILHPASCPGFFRRVAACSGGLRPGVLLAARQPDAMWQKCQVARRQLAVMPAGHSAPNRSVRRGSHTCPLHSRTGAQIWPRGVIREGETNVHSHDNQTCCSAPGHACSAPGHVAIYLRAVASGGAGEWGGGGRRLRCGGGGGTPPSGRGLAPADSLAPPGGHF